MCRLISASILGPVFGNHDQFLGLAIFLDTFRNDLHGMDVSVVARGFSWLTACFSTGPVFSNNAHFHGLAVFIDTYSNDDATDVSGRSGFTRPHVVSMQLISFICMMSELKACYLSLRCSEVAELNDNSSFFQMNPISNNHQTTKLRYDQLLTEL